MITTSIKKYNNHFLIFYAILLPLGHALQNIGILLLALYWGFSFFPEKKIKKRNIYLVFLFGIYFISQFFSLLNSDNIKRGAELLVLQSPLIIIPFFLLSADVRVNNKVINKCLWGFTISLIFVLLLNLFCTIIKYEYNFDTILTLPGKEFAYGIVNYHYLYLSYYISSSILLLTYFSVKENKPKFIFVKIICGIFLFSYMILLGGRMSLFITALGLIAILFYHFYKAMKNIYSIFLLFLIFLVSFSAYKLNLPIVEKAKELVNYNGQYSDIKKQWGGRMMREEIWVCSWKLISGNPILGYGLGSVQNNMTNCLKENSEFPILYTGKYRFNAHNQFFQYWLSAGLFGLLCFLLFIFITLRKSYSKNNFSFMLFLVLSMLTFLTESALERNHGIVFFSFLCALLYSNQLNNK